jgi:hypothetical protein
MSHETRSSACAANPAERTLRAILAVGLAAFAAGTAATAPWLAVMLAIAAAPAAIGAISGRCPVDLVRHRREQKRNILGIAEARQHIDVGPKE